VRRLPSPTPAERAALAALGVACLLLGGAVAQAVRLDPAPAPAPVPATLAPVSDGQLAVVDDEALAGAVAADPFSPSRAGIVSDDAGGQVVGDEAIPASVPPPAEPPQVRLLGVVVLGEGRGSAALSVAGGPEQLVRVGQQVDRWVLERVGPGTASLARRDDRLVLRIGAPGAAGATP
jgi:hypothetical protein